MKGRLKVNTINDSTLKEDMEFISNSMNFKQLEDKTILLTGSTGLVGSQLLRALHYCNNKYNLNLTIVAIVRNISKFEKMFGMIDKKDNIILIQSDITDITENNIPSNISIDYIIHAASITASKQMISQPVDTIMTALMGTHNILEIAKKHAVNAFVYISSMEVYGSFNDETYVHEDTMGYINPLALRSNYPLGKRMCENMCIAYSEQYRVPVRIARLSQTFGAGILPGENRVFAQFARSVIYNKDIVLHTKGLSEGNYCYTRDTITAILTIMLNGENQNAYNVSNEECHTTIADMAKMVASKLASGQINVIFDIPETNSYGYACDTKMKLNTDKLRKLGWKPSVNLEEAYRRLIKSMIETRMTL